MASSFVVYGFLKQTNAVCRAHRYRFSPAKESELQIRRRWL
jgi:hypothetical protein